MTIMRRHLVIISSSIVLRDTLTLDEDPGESEYTSVSSARLIDGTRVQLCEHVLGGCTTSREAFIRSPH
jgi:hypothetical protein